MVSRIRELCAKNNISLMRLEKECGFSNGSINKWDRQRPTADKLYAVAQRFNVSMEYLLTGKESSPDSNEPRLSAESLMVAKHLDTLPVEIRQLYLSRLEALKQALPDPGALPKSAKPE